jgi:rare lipoprotein A (peptidoglycan hydrolase)
VSATVGLRLAVLAGVTLLTVVGVLAIAAAADSPDTRPSEERSVPAPGGGWYETLAAPYRLDTATKRTVCGHRARPKTMGVAHPVLPCGTKLYLSYDGKEVLTQVIDRGTGAPGREFEVTAALARELQLAGVQPIRWRYAAR